MVSEANPAACATCVRSIILRGPFVVCRDETETPIWGSDAEPFMGER
jgi:hypothetical protein